MSAAATNSAPATITWTRFPDQAAKTKRELTQDFAEFLDHLLNAGPYRSKHECPWLKLAIFGNVRTDKEALRNNRNVLKVTGVEGDYDGEKVRPEEAVAMLERAGLRAIVYTSPSHRPDRPRWRVLCPLATPAHPDERSRLLARVNGAVGGILAAESFTLSQSYFYGRVEGQDDYRVLATFDDPSDGSCVDELHDLDKVAVVASAMPNGVSDDEVPAAHCIAEAVKLIGRPLRTGDNRRALLRRYIGSRSGIGLSPGEINALVSNVAEQYFDPSDPIDEANVHELIDHICSADRQEREEIDRTVGGFIRGVVAPTLVEAVSLPVVREIDMSAAFSAPVCAPEFVIPEWLPARAVTLLSSHGSGGKSQIALYIAICAAAGRSVLGAEPQPRMRSMFWSCEDDDRVLKFRIQQICAAADIDPASLHGWLFVIDRTEQENILYTRHQNPAARVTATYKAVAEYVDRHAIRLSVLDNASDLYDADEIDRAAVRSFLSRLKSLATRHNGAVLLLGHASKEASKSQQSGHQYSGSTAWHNSVRSRWELLPEKRDRQEDGLDDDFQNNPPPDVRRILTCVKSNYGREGHSVAWHWNHIHLVLLPEPARSPLEVRVAREHDEAAVLRAVLWCNENGVRVTTNATGSTNYRSALKQAPQKLGGIKVGPVLEALAQDGRLQKEEYKKSNWGTGRHFVVTEAGRNAVRK